MCGDHQLLYQWRWNWIFPVGVILSLSPYFKSFLFCGLLDLFVYIVLFFFPGTERARVEDQVDPQAQEALHDSSTDSCPTIPYSSDSPKPFPSTSSISHPFQTHPSILLSPTTNSFNTPLYPSYPPSSFPLTCLSAFAGISSISPYFGPSFPNTVPMPSQPLPPMTTLRTVPLPFSSTLPQCSLGPSPFGRSVRIPRGTPSGRRRAPRGRRSKITSTAGCQSSPIPSYFWPDFQSRRASSGGPPADGALDLALMPRAYSCFPTSLPLDPLHFDFFTILRVASPVVTFHCPSPLTQKSFSFVYSIRFPHGEDAKPSLITGIHR